MKPDIFIKKLLFYYLNGDNSFINKFKKNLKNNEYDLTKLQNLFTQYLFTLSDLKFKDDNIINKISSHSYNLAFHLKVSKFYKSEPIPRSDQQWYVNGVVEICTTLIARLEKPCVLVCFSH